MNRIIRIFQAFSLTSLLAFPIASLSQMPSHYPERPIKLVVPFGAGGITDLTARTIARLLEVQLGQPVVVENKPGAGGNIAASLVAKAKPDGYTLMVMTNGMVAVNPLIYSSQSYSALQDFTCLSMISNTPLVVVVGAGDQTANIRALIENARARPNVLPFASSGEGTSIHQVLALLQKSTNVSFIHVPYKSGAEAATALLSGGAAITAVETVVVNSFIQSGKMRALAITSPQRMPSLPNLPTVKESLGIDFEVGSISSMVVPKGTPPEIVEKLEKAISAAVLGEGMKQFFSQGSLPMPGGSNSCTTRMNLEKNKWKQVFDK